MNISAVREGLAVRARTISGLRAYGYTPNEIEPPVFYAGEVDIDFDQAMGRGLDVILVTCRVFTSYADDRSGQAALDGYLAGSGASSIKAAIEGDKTLGGACSTLRVERLSGYAKYEVGNTSYFGAKFEIRIYGAG